MTRAELAIRWPGIEADLAAVDEWLQAEAVHRLVTEPMARFIDRAQYLLDTYPDFPAEKTRTDVIIATIQAGGELWPIFVDSEDDFILEGRHRIVAFHILGLTTIPVIYVSKPLAD
jgi:ParB-like chromosome segregation protein Spo0J